MIKQTLPILVLFGLAAVAPCRGRTERAEIELVYRNMQKAYADKDIKAYSANWTPAIRWFPPHKAFSATLTKGRAELLHDLRVEFAKPERVSQDYTFIRFDTESDRATVDLAVSITRFGHSPLLHTTSERHHWLKAGGRWWLSRVEAIG